MEIEITTNEQYEQETRSGKVLVDFYATWCGPCQLLSPIVKKVAEEHPELKVLKVDVDKVGAPAAKLNVYSIPTLVLYQDGKIINTSTGYRPKESLLAFLGY